MKEMQQEISQILRAIDSGDPDARGQLIEAAYEDLRQLAAGRMAHNRQNHTLTATALVHEVALKLLGDRSVPTESRGQFFAYAAKAMRNYLIDHARGKGRLIRGGDRARVPLEGAETGESPGRGDKGLIELDEALTTFAEIDPRKAQVVEMKYFGRMTNEEIAEALDVSLATVKRDWQIARAWLQSELQ